MKVVYKSVCFWLFQWLMTCSEREYSAFSVHWCSVMLWLWTDNCISKSSAVAEMGDRLATIDMGWKVGMGCCGDARSSLGHQLTQCGLGRGLPLYQVASWSSQPFGHNCGNAMLLCVGIPLRAIFIRSLVVTRQNISSTRALSYCSIPIKIK